jgi:hypothetical protein
VEASRKMKVVPMKLVLEVVDKHINRCRERVAQQKNWSPAQAEWHRARDAIQDVRDELLELERKHTI